VCGTRNWQNTCSTATLYPHIHQELQIKYLTACGLFSQQKHMLADIVCFKFRKINHTIIKKINTRAGFSWRQAWAPGIRVTMWETVKPLGLSKCIIKYY